MIIRRLKHGGDLNAEIKRVCREEKVKTGWFNVVGALKNLTLACYDQTKKRYVKIHPRGSYEISSCMGNISLAGGEVFVHAHINASDGNGNVRGGHLLAGEIFAAELALFPSRGTLERKFDRVTGLKLWK
jgi:predicted DNA-binding protein with PD1-like motif